MKVVNSLNKIPLPAETMVMNGCHCACVAGVESTQSGIWVPLLPKCGCGCDGSTTNYNATFQIAYEKQWA